MTGLTGRVYKLLRPAEWDSLKGETVFSGSADDLRDGYIHLSLAQQVRGSAEKHFVKDTELVLAAIEAASLAPNLKWEMSRGGENFPHLYGQLPLTLVKQSWHIVRGHDGRFVFPIEIA